jgi:hypothetical protein
MDREALLRNVDASHQARCHHLPADRALQRPERKETTALAPPSRAVCRISSRLATNWRSAQPYSISTFVKTQMAPGSLGPFALM